MAGSLRAIVFSPVLESAVVGVQVDLLVLDAAPQPLDEHVVPRHRGAMLRIDAPLASMLILMSLAASTPVKAGANVGTGTLAEIAAQSGRNLRGWYGGI